MPLILKLSLSKPDQAQCFEKKKLKKSCWLIDGFSVDMHCIAPVHNEYEMNAETKVHLAQAQASVYKAESFAGLKIFLLYLFDKKKKQ